MSPRFESVPLGPGVLPLTATAASRTVLMLDVSKPSHAEYLARELAGFGQRYDSNPAFPSQSMQALVDCGLHTYFAPGSGELPRYSCSQLFYWLRVIGRADLSVGRLFEGHVNALKLIEWFGSASQIRRLRSNLDAGKFYGVWATEPASGLHLRGDGVLDGSKCFASGAGHIDYAIVTVNPPEGSRRLMIVPANNPKRADLSGWRVRGMKATMSGSYDLTGHVPEADDFLGLSGQYDEEPRFTAGAWRFTAVQLGGIEALVTETRVMMSDAARADPLQRVKFAEAVEAMTTARFWVSEAARKASHDDPDNVAFVRMTRGVVERAAMEAMTIAARIVGTRSAFDGQRIDKIIRDLSLYLRQAGQDYSRDQAAIAWLDREVGAEDDPLW